MKKILGKLESSSDKEKVKKLFCQMGYYLKKADAFFKLGNDEATAMAIIGAGNCARDFNRSGCNPEKQSVTADLVKLRTNVAHIFSNERNPQSLKTMISEMMDGVFLQPRVQKLQEEARAMQISVDMDAYYHQMETVSWPESPKAYDSVILLDTAPVDVVSPSSSIRINEERASDSNLSARSADTATRLTTTPVVSDLASVDEDAAQGKRSRSDLISTEDDERKPVSKKARNDEEEPMSKKVPR